MAMMGRAGVMVVAAVAAWAPGRQVYAAEKWQAASTTATAITGDVVFDTAGVRLGNGKTLHLSIVSTDSAFKDGEDRVRAQVYRVDPPGDPVLLHGNRLCGGAGKGVAATFVVVWHPEPIGADTAPRSMAVSSGKAAPSGDADATICGIYNYEAVGTAP